VTYLIVLGLVVLAGVAALWWVARLVFSPPEIYRKGRTSFGDVMCCRHCDAVVTKDNIEEHGVNCPKRPPGRPGRRP
jgi:hypothetical protein